MNSRTGSVAEPDAQPGRNPITLWTPVQIERTVLRGLLYAMLLASIPVIVGGRSAAASNNAVLSGTIALAGLACSCRRD
jgi:hypothetical protein